MKNVIKSFILISILTLLSGCVSAPPIKTPPIQNVNSDRARIILTRSTDFLYLALDARISINGKVVASLPRGESTYYDVAPGTATISVDHPTSPGTFAMSFITKAGNTYKTRVAPRESGFGAGALFGVVGVAVEASPGNGGLFSVHLISITENKNKQSTEKKDNNNGSHHKSDNDYIKELEQIKKLFDSGIINKKEFKILKQKIIDRLK